MDCEVLEFLSRSRGMTTPTLLTFLPDSGRIITDETPTTRTCVGVLGIMTPMHVRRIANCPRLMQPTRVASLTDCRRCSHRCRLDVALTMPLDRLATVTRRVSVERQAH